MTSQLTAGGYATVGPTSGGKVYAFNNLSSTPQVIAPANPQRASITFHNPGTIDIYVAPSVVQANNSIPATSITNSTLTPSTSALGGCFKIAAGGGYFSLSGECTGAYQAFSASGTNNPLTVADSNA